MIKKIFAITAILTFSPIFGGAVAFADEIYNDVDVTIDTNIETLNLTVGNVGTVTLHVQPTNDTKNGCNFGGPGVKTFTANVNVSNTSASIAETSVTFDSCGDAIPLHITANSVGIANVTLTPGTNTTGGTFELATASFNVVVAPAAPTDTTAPVITPTVLTLNSEGWSNNDVTVSWDVNDAESSGSIVKDGCDTVTYTEETDGTIVTCNATSDGGSSTASVTVKIDKTAPVITETTRTPTANSNGWNNAPVTVNFSCTETGPIQSGLDTNTVSSGTVSTDGADQSVSNGGTCTDVAGNVADSATATATGINIDTIAPVITIVNPTATTYTFGQISLADWSANDGLSGIDPVLTDISSNGAAIDTSSIGSKTFSASATDNAGNVSSASVTYTVVGYTYSGPSSPLSISLKDFKKMSTIPVKFKLTDQSNNPIITAVPTLKVGQAPAVSSGNSNTLNQFRYDTSGAQYIYNLSTRQISIGPNTLWITLGDGSAPRQISITVK